VCSVNSVRDCIWVLTEHSEITENPRIRYAELCYGRDFWILNPVTCQIELSCGSNFYIYKVTYSKVFFAGGNYYFIIHFWRIKFCSSDKLASLFAINKHLKCFSCSVSPG
jgi:hypothetical protein